MTSFTAKTAISVIICTINRLDEVELCLKSFLGQTNHNFEIIVVDGRTDNKLVRLFKQLSKNLKIKHLRVKKQNLPYQRNIGIENATSPIIAFIDDDAVASQDWIQCILDSFSKDKDVVVIGGKILSLTKDCIARFSEKLFFYGLHKKEVTTVTGVNMAIHIKRLKRLTKHKGRKIFNEKLIIAGDETEACFYIKKVGGKLIYEPSVLVHHQFPTSLLGFLKRQLDYACGDFWVMTKPQYLSFSLIRDYLLPLNRKLNILLAPFLISKAIIKRSYNFIHQNGLVWFPLILIKEITYSVGLYLTLLKKIKI